MKLLFRENINKYILKLFYSRGTGPPQACLNAMLHSSSRGKDSMFYRVAGKVGVYGLMVIELSVTAIYLIVSY